MMKIYMLNHEEFLQRAKEKDLSRKKDQQDLDSGNKTRDQLRQENGVFSQLKAKPNLIAFLNRR